MLNVKVKARCASGLLVLTLVGVGVGVVVATPASAGGGGGGGCHEMTEGVGGEVELKGFCFTPSVLRVEPGTEVTWTNGDPAEHVVVGTGWGLEATLGGGDSGTHRFEEAGTFPYTCYLHPGMNGVVVVGDDAPAAVTPATTDRETAELTGAAPALSGDVDGGTSPMGAGAVGGAAGLATGAIGARVWARRRSS